MKKNKQNKSETGSRRWRLQLMRKPIKKLKKPTFYKEQTLQNFSKVTVGTMFF